MLMSSVSRQLSVVFSLHWELTGEPNMDTFCGRPTQMNPSSAPTQTVVMLQWNYTISKNSKLCVSFKPPSHCLKMTGGQPTKPRFGSRTMMTESTFAWGNTGKEAVCNSCFIKRKFLSQLSEYCQIWMLTAFTISVTCTRSCMSYTAIQCSHATHKASCCSPLPTRQGAYLRNAMSLLGFHIRMSSSLHYVIACICVSLAT